MTDTDESTVGSETSARELDARFAEYRRTHDRELRNELVEAHARLAEFLARRFQHRGEPLDDLRQVALVGLLKAVERFEPERGLQFSSFATPTIVGELKRHFRDKGWAVRVPRRIQELHLELEQTVATLTQELRRPPSTAEIAERAGAWEEDVLEAMEANSLYRLPSIDAARNDGETRRDRRALRRRRRGVRRRRRPCRGARASLGAPGTRAADHLSAVLRRPYPVGDRH